MSLRRNAALLCAAAVALAATLVARAPHLVLRVPHVGLILWHVIGNPLSPMTDEHTYDHCLKSGDARCSFFKSGDVMAAAAPKCGTNWLMSILHELRSVHLPNSVRDFEDVLDVTPWADMRHYPGESLEERISSWGNQWNDTRYAYRALKTHLVPRSAARSTYHPNPVAQLPVLERPDIKFIPVVRHPEEMMSSVYEFMFKATPDYQDLWGGFGFTPESLSQIVDFISGDIYPNIGLSVAEYLRDWWPVRNQPNVLLLHYTEMVKDLPGTLKRIADFVGLKNLTAADFKEVESRVSFDYMKKHGDRYLYSTGPGKKMKLLVPGGLVRAGGSKDRERFTDEDRKKFRQHAERHLTPEQVEFLYQ